jgi:hypothetical protein
VVDVDAFYFARDIVAFIPQNIRLVVHLLPFLRPPLVVQNGLRLHLGQLFLVFTPFQSLCFIYALSVAGEVVDVKYFGQHVVTTSIAEVI